MDVLQLFRAFRGVYSQTPQLPFNSLLRRSILGNFVFIQLDIYSKLFIGTAILILFHNFIYYFDIIMKNSLI